MAFRKDDQLAKLWQDVFVATARSGADYKVATHQADMAVEQFRARFEWDGYGWVLKVRQ